MVEQQVDAARILSSFSTKIKGLEERQESLKEKTLLLGQSFQFGLNIVEFVSPVV